MAQLPGEVYTRICMTPGAQGSLPTDCVYVLVKGEVFFPPDTGLNKEQWDELFGAIIGVVVLVIIFAILKKAIEQ